jgi:ABC-2 type transport system ATP-binding protein
MLNIQGLSHSYGRNKQALRNVSFTANTGIVGVLGRNGAGKSTLMRILATIMLPSEGVVLWDSTDSIKRPEPLRQATAYLPQDTSYPSNVSARTYIRYLLSLRGTPMDGADRWLAELGLGDVANKKLHSYSGGMRQRAGLAYALACDARILLLDEPTQGLDPWERTRFHMVLAQLATNRLILFSTHIVTDIEAVANRIIVLDDGAVRYDGTPQALVADVHADPVWVVRSDIPLQQTGYTVSAVRRLADGMFETRGIGQPLPPGADLVEPLLEDRYLRMTDTRAQAQRSALAEV